MVSFQSDGARSFPLCTRSFAQRARSFVQRARSFPRRTRSFARCARPFPRRARPRAIRVCRIALQTCEARLIPPRESPRTPGFNVAGRRSRRSEWIATYGGALRDRHLFMPSLLAHTSHLGSGPSATTAVSSSPALRHILPTGFLFASNIPWRPLRPAPGVAQRSLGIELDDYAVAAAPVDGDVVIPACAAILGVSAMPALTRPRPMIVSSMP